MSKSATTLKGDEDKMPMQKTSVDAANIPDAGAEPADSTLSIPADGAVLYVINDASDIRDVRVDEYKLVRWTEHNWFVMQRGSEKKIRKSRTTFINRDALETHLKERKKREYESAVRRVEALTLSIEVPIHVVPHERYTVPTEPLKL